MISAISWIPKGASKAVPALADPPSKEELEEIKSSILQTHVGVEDENDDYVEEDFKKDMEVEESTQEDDITQALAAADSLQGKGSGGAKAGDSLADALKDLDMDNYDDEVDGVELFGEGVQSLYYASNDMDPYLKNADGEDSEEEEDMTIKPDDAVIVCARNEDEVSHLEVWILEESEGAELNTYVHHDIVIPEFPLCLAWTDCPLKGGERGNFIAVGSMDPTIEIWDLDIMDEVEPSTVLGGVIEKKIKKGKKKSIKYKDGSHSDSVLGLAWNREYRNVLASASADKTVKIWDVATGQCSYTLEHHTDRVQAVAWNHFAPKVLLSGSFDHSVVMKDARVPSHAGFKWSVTADVESLAWDPHTEHSFVVSLENGMVSGFDIRAASSDPTSHPEPSFTLHPHNKAVCSVSYNRVVPNLLATGSMDKTVQLWDLSDNKPTLVAMRNPKAGAVFSVAFSDDFPFVLAVGGSKGKLELWKTLSDDAVSSKYGKYTKQKPAGKLPTNRESLLPTK